MPSAICKPAKIGRRLFVVPILSQLALRLLFVAACAFVASQIYWVQEREAFVSRIRGEGRFAMYPVNAWRSRPEVVIPFWRTWLGDQAYGDLGVIVRSRADETVVAEASRLFPEAEVTSGEFHLGGLWIGR